MLTHTSDNKLPPPLNHHPAMQLDQIVGKLDTRPKIRSVRILGGRLRKNITVTKAGDITAPVESSDHCKNTVINPLRSAPAIVNPSISHSKTSSPPGTFHAVWKRHNVNPFGACLYETEIILKPSCHTIALQITLLFTP